MFTLSDGPFSVELLDPVADKNKLGSRYCVGGYIWQIKHAKYGPLLSGPKYPDPPNGFDGQGFPEVFEIALGQNNTPIGGELTVIGVGKVPRESPVKPFHVRDNFGVNEFALWKVETGPLQIRFETEQQHQQQALHLTKIVELKNGILSSKTKVVNRGTTPLAIRWFAHPFFPLAGSRACKLSVETFMPNNPYYSLDDEGWIGRNLGADWVRGFFQPLTCAFGYPISVEISHPHLGKVLVECDFPVAHFPIWGNDRTFSFEPYFHTVLSSGGESEWAIRYHLA